MKKQKNYSFTTQFVNCNFGKPEQIISNFDFVNAMIAFDNEFIYTSKDRRKIEKEKVLEINPSINHNSILPWRIKRYMSKYEYTLSDNSRKILQEYVFEMISSSSECPHSQFLPKNKQSILNVSGRLNSVIVPSFEMMAIAFLPYIPDDLLIYFMGKLSKIKSGAYSIYHVDLAVEEMKNRLNRSKNDI